jgi:chaperone required for assembly of F1-ATPase
MNDGTKPRPPADRVLRLVKRHVATMIRLLTKAPQNDRARGQLEAFRHVQTVIDNKEHG